MKNTIDIEAGKAPTDKWEVKGDHPILPRPDKTFKGHGAQHAAYLYAAELLGAGYENVKVQHVS